jgi:hypothetical protein
VEDQRRAADVVVVAVDAIHTDPSAEGAGVLDHLGMVDVET